MSKPKSKTPSAKGKQDEETNPTLVIESPKEDAIAKDAAPASQSNGGDFQAALEALKAELASLKAKLASKEEKDDGDDEEEDEEVGLINTGEARDLIEDFVANNQDYMIVGESEHDCFVEIVRSVKLMVKRNKSLSVFNPYEPITEELTAVYAVIGWNEYLEHAPRHIYKARMLGAKILRLRKLKELSSLMHSIGE